MAKIAMTKQEYGKQKGFVYMNWGIPADLLEWIKVRAIEEDRSVTAQAVHIFRQAKRAQEAQEGTAA